MIKMIESFNKKMEMMEEFSIITMDSSMMESISITTDGSNFEVVLHFKSGGDYGYYPVTEKTAITLITADSIGKTYWKLRKQGLLVNGQRL